MSRAEAQSWCLRPQVYSSGKFYYLLAGMLTKHTLCLEAWQTLEADKLGRPCSVMGQGKAPQNKFWKGAVSQRTLPACPHWGLKFSPDFLQTILSTDSTCLSTLEPEILHPGPSNTSAGMPSFGDLWHWWHASETLCELSTPKIGWPTCPGQAFRATPVNTC